MEKPTEGSVNAPISKEGNSSTSNLENDEISSSKNVDVFQTRDRVVNELKQIDIKVVDQVIEFLCVCQTLFFCYIYKIFNLSHWSCRMGWKSTSKLKLARH